MLRDSHNIPTTKIASYFRSDVSAHLSGKTAPVGTLSLVIGSRKSCHQIGCSQSGLVAQTDADFPRCPRIRIVLHAPVPACVSQLIAAYRIPALLYTASSLMSDRSYTRPISGQILLHLLLLTLFTNNLFPGNLPHLSTLLIPAKRPKLSKLQGRIKFLIH